ncbi:MAG: HAMP domain-containing protein [Coriobacteriia bacterium]|nr:HAMP domain-containing protein [Coriobacteriia bacterium]
MKPMRASLRRRITLTIFAAALLGAGIMAAEAYFLPGRPLVLAGTLAAIVVVALPLGRAVARSVTSPLERLGAVATSFASGGHSSRADATGPREVRIIAEAFNRMAGEVDVVVNELKAEERRKTQFVSDVSHELRTPLTAIRGAAETLLDGDVEPEDQQRFLTTIALEAERLGRLANDLLTLQRIEGATGELPLRQVDLRLAADRAAAMLEPLLEDREVTLTVNGRAPLVLGDVDRLQQVVLNLVDNASRIVGEGGHVQVELSAEGDLAVLSVIDDGPGIDESDLPRLFDRFYRADSSRTRQSGGSGLGLAIVRAIVSAHGGHIEAENTPNGGAKLTVKLPALPAEKTLDELLPQV